MHIFCSTAGDIGLCRVGEVRLGMICLKVAVKFVTAKGRLWLEKEGTRGQHWQPGETEGLLNSVPRERLQGGRRARDAVGLGENLSSGS